MPYRDVTMVEIKEVLRLWLEGVGKKPIAVRLGLDPKTVRRYIRAAQDQGLDPQGGASALTEEVLGAVVLALRDPPGRPRGESWAVCVGSLGITGHNRHVNALENAYQELPFVLEACSARARRALSSASPSARWIAGTRRDSRCLSTEEAAIESLRGGATDYVPASPRRKGTGHAVLASWRARPQKARPNLGREKSARMRSTPPRSRASTKASRVETTSTRHATRWAKTQIDETSQHVA